MRKQLAKNRSKQQEATSGDTNLGLEEEGLFRLAAGNGEVNFPVLSLVQSRQYCALIGCR